jgi:hypothetical protein
VLSDTHLKKVVTLFISIIFLNSLFLGDVHGLEAPSAPTITNASAAGANNGDAAIKLTWPAIVGAIGFKAKCTASGYSASIPIPISPGATTYQTTFSSLTGGTTYSCYISAVDINQVQTDGPTTQFTAQSVPDAPTLGTQTSGSQQVILNWSAPTNFGGTPITGYTITEKSLTTPITEASNTTSATISKLTPGASYSFAITASNAIGESSASTFATIQVPNVPDAPAKPTGSVSGTSITTTWSAPASNGATITSYTARLYGASGSALSSAKVTVTTAVFSGLASGNYTVTVSATNLAGEGAESTKSDVQAVSSGGGLLDNTPVFSPATLIDISVGASENVSATAPSGGVVTISVTSTPLGSCTYSGGIIRAISIGTCTVQLTSPATGTYQAGSASSTFSVKKNSQTINFPTISNQKVGSSVSLNATATSGLPISYSSSGHCSILGNSVLNSLSEGFCYVTASQAGSNAYSPASVATNSFLITASDSGGGGGGGGGGCPQCSGMGFKLVSPDNPNQVLNKSACIEVYTAGSVVYLVTSGCTHDSSKLLFSAVDGKYTFHVFEAGHPLNYTLYSGLLKGGKFYITGQSYLDSPGFYPVTIPAGALPTQTPVPTAAPQIPIGGVKKPVNISLSPTSLRDIKFFELEKSILIIPPSAQAKYFTINPNATKSQTLSLKLSSAFFLALPQVSTGTLVEYSVIYQDHNSVKLFSKKLSASGPVNFSGLQFKKLGSYKLKIAIEKKIYVFVIKVSK